MLGVEVFLYPLDEPVTQKEEASGDIGISIMHCR